MDRTEAFEKMLADVLEQERSEKEQLDALRAQGRDKTATQLEHRQHRNYENNCE